MLRITLTVLLFCNVAFGLGSCASANNHPDYILFGKSCGECMGHCTTMYKYSMANGKSTLFTDTTDSYFKNNGKVICNILITDAKKMRIADSLAQLIPVSLLASLKDEQTFGCPDCHDQCGLYFEMGQGSRVKKFYIDTDAKKLPPEIKDLGEAIKKALEELK